MTFAAMENERAVMGMAEYIACRRCDSPDCKGCNLERLETMLKNGKFDCLMNENRSINTSYDVETVRHGRWIEQEKYTFGVMYDCSLCGDRILDNGHSWNYCPNCGARMDGGSNG